MISEADEKMFVSIDFVVLTPGIGTLFTYNVILVNITLCSVCRSLKSPDYILNNTDTYYSRS